LENGLTDVEEKLAWAAAHPAEAEAIARNAKEFAREHLHVPSIACYWWQLLAAMAELQPFQPRTSGFKPL